MQGLFVSRGWRRPNLDGFRVWSRWFGRIAEMVRREHDSITFSTAGCTIAEKGQAWGCTTVLGWADDEAAVTIDGRR